MFEYIEKMKKNGEKIDFTEAYNNAQLAKQREEFPDAKTTKIVGFFC